MSKTKPNPHCPVPRCKTRGPHMDDPTVQGLFAEFSDPERTALWTMTAIGEVLNSMAVDLAAGRHFALILRLRQVEELYVRALYAMFIADDGELAHILSDEYPNSFSEMYRKVNEVVLEGPGPLEVEYPGLNSGVFTAMDTINQGAHASFSAMMMVIGFARHPEHLEPYTSGRYFKHVDCLATRRGSYGKRFQMRIWITKSCAGKLAWEASGNNDSSLLLVGKEATSREKRKPSCPRHAYGWMVTSEVASPAMRRLSSPRCGRTIHFRKSWGRG